MGITVAPLPGFERIPLAKRFGRERSRGSERVNRSGNVMHIARSVGVGIVARVIDLNFVPLIYRRFPVPRRVAAAKCRKSNKDPGIVGRID